jgi:hypothetical protein
MSASSSALLKGLGWGGMPLHTVRQDLFEGRLAKLSIEDFPDESLIMRMSAVYLTANPPGPAGRWLIERLKQCSGQLRARKLRSRTASKHRLQRLSGPFARNARSVRRSHTHWAVASTGKPALPPVLWRPRNGNRRHQHPRHPPDGRAERGPLPVSERRSSSSVTLTTPVLTGLVAYFASDDAALVIRRYYYFGASTCSSGVASCES